MKKYEVHIIVIFKFIINDVEFFYICILIYKISLIFYCIIIL